MKRNFFLGNGERLTGPVEVPKFYPGKEHPYTLGDRKEVLRPLATAVARELGTLPSSACPRNESVAVLTLHPSYIAKSFHPTRLLSELDLSVVGSRRAEVLPVKRVGKSQEGDAPVVTNELFVAGKRTTFEQLAQGIAAIAAGSSAAEDLLGIESIRALKPEERVRPIGREIENVLLEVVLHRGTAGRGDYVLRGFVDYLRTLQLTTNPTEGFETEGLTFLPVQARREEVLAIARYSFLRVARPMPRLRRFRPHRQSFTEIPDWKAELPAGDVVAQSIRVAVFDGGVSKAAGLDRWVSRIKANGVKEADDDAVEHGTAVTSALLFGPLSPKRPPVAPYAKVSHYRVCDVDTDANDLYPVLHRIKGVLDRETFDFINLSIGPDLPIEDHEVHAWTAVLDERLASGKTLATVAVGNRGDQDWDRGDARVQSPSDCVNALGVGAADKLAGAWRRAEYSCIGPGRAPGVVKPDVLEFGGSRDHPFWVVSPAGGGTTRQEAGTSFASPCALRTAIGLRAHFGDVLTPVVLRAMLVHSADAGGHGRREVGWGRIETELERYALCADDEVRVIYRDELAPGKWVRIPVPLPDGPLAGRISIKATFCFATATDPEDTLNYTRSGLEVVFRPNETARTKASPESLHGKTRSFFQLGALKLDEATLRSDALKWETTLHAAHRLLGSKLLRPAFDVHYNAREGGAAARSAPNVPYALVLTVKAPKAKALYDDTYRKYARILQPIRPVLEIPVRT